MNKQKFNLEKMLHEIIRDLPEAQTAEKYFTKGYLTNADALEAIVKAIREEKARANA